MAMHAVLSSTVASSPSKSLPHALPLPPPLPCPGVRSSTLQPHPCPFADEIPDKTNATTTSSTKSNSCCCSSSHGDSMAYSWTLVSAAAIVRLQNLPRSDARAMFAPGAIAGDDPHRDRLGSSRESTAGDDCQHVGVVTRGSGLLSATPFYRRNLDKTSCPMCLPDTLNIGPYLSYVKEWVDFNPFQRRRQDLTDTYVLFVTLAVPSSLDGSRPTLSHLLDTSAQLTSSQCPE